MNFRFCSITNSFIAGMHPVVGGKSTDYATGSVILQTNARYFGPGLYRIHYKVHGISYNPGTDYVEFKIACTNGTSIYGTKIARSDQEGWVVLPFECETRLTITYVSTAKVIAYKYVELDAFEKVCKDAPFIPALIYSLGTPVGEKDWNGRSWLVAKQNSGADPTNYPIVTMDASIPTFDNQNARLPADYSYNGTNYWLVGGGAVQAYCVQWYREYYYGTQSMRNGGFIPYVIKDQLAKYGPAIVPVYAQNASIENFSLAGYYGKWYKPEISLYNWLYTEEGLRTPISGGNCSIATSIENILGKAIVIHYTVVIGPRGIFGGRVRVKATNYSGNYAYLDVGTAGAKSMEIPLTATSTVVTFLYTPAVYGFYLDDEQAYVVINSIELVGRPRKVVNGYSVIPSFEDWSNGLNNIPWVFTGSWNYWTPVIAPTDYVLVSPVSDNDESAEISFTVDCIDGYIYFAWAVNSEQECDFLEFYIDNVWQRTITGVILGHSLSFPVSLGTHTFKWRYETDGSYVQGANCGILKFIQFPTVDNLVYDYSNRDLLTPTYASVLAGVEGAEPWIWQEASSLELVPKGIYCNVTNSVPKTIQIDCPIGDNALVVNFNLQYIGDGTISLYNDSYVRAIARCSWNANKLFDTVIQTCGPHSILNSNERQTATMPYPLPESGTGTIYIDIVGLDTNPSGIMLFVENISLPVTITEQFSISPTEDVVQFPIDCILTTQDPTVDIYYTLDGTDPSSSVSKIKYSSSIRLTEPKIVRYTTYKQSAGYGNIDIKYYLDKPLTSPRMLYHRYTLNGTKYIKLYSTSWDVPIVYGIISDTNVFIPHVYNEQPLLVTSDMKAIVFGLLTSRGIPLTGNTAAAWPVTYNIDYSTLDVVVLDTDAPPSEWPRSSSSMLALCKESFVFTPTVIPSLPAGSYKSGTALTLRSNMGSTVWYSIDNQAVDVQYTNPISLVSPCSIYVQAEENSVRGPLQVFTYQIYSSIESSNILFAHITHVSETMSALSCCLEQAAVSYAEIGAIKKGAASYSNLPTTFKQLSYKEYTSYITDNNVYTLFADEALTLPFPFVFTLIINPGQYFPIPDDYASVYINGNKTIAYEQTDLICRFNDSIASDTEIQVISDYCLRLCIDTVKSSRPSIVTQVWTNIPVGNYLSTTSEYVTLSLDGVTFTRVIQLQTNTLYIKGTLPASAEYGYNLTDVVIKLATCEAIDEYTV